MIHDCLSALCTFFTLVVGEKLVDSNPEYELILPERKQIAPKILTLSQIVKCLNAPTNAYQLRHISLQNALRDAMILHLFLWSRHGQTWVAKDKTTRYRFLESRPNSSWERQQRAYLSIYGSSFNGDKSIPVEIVARHECLPFHPLRWQDSIHSGDMVTSEIISKILQISIRNVPAHAQICPCQTSFEQPDNLPLIRELPDHAGLETAQIYRRIDSGDTKIFINTATHTLRPMENKEKWENKMSLQLDISVFIGDHQPADNYSVTLRKNDSFLEQLRSSQYWLYQINSFVWEYCAVLNIYSSANIIHYAVTNFMIFIFGGNVPADKENPQFNALNFPGWRDANH